MTGPREPPPDPAGPPVYVLTGQLAAGKSTVARALLRTYPFGCLVDVDAVREMVVSGLASPVEWTEETTRQFALAVRAGAAMAAVYHRAGFAVVVEGAVDPQEVGTALEAEGLGAAVVGVVLHPPLDVALARNATRTHKGFDTAPLAAVIRRLDEDLRTAPPPTGWHVVDNDGESVEETVRRVLALPPARAGDSSGR